MRPGLMGLLWVITFKRIKHITKPSEKIFVDIHLLPRYNSKMISIALTHEKDSPTFSQQMLENQWSYLFEIVVPDKIYILCLHDHEDSWLNDPSINSKYQLITSYDEITEPLTYITPTNARSLPGETSLVSYTHPETACYVFGPNDSDLTSSTPGDKVYIPQSADWQYYNWVAAAITFYDRLAKNGNT